mmetsp:Transcript_31964/g.92398  ORF Transcript_31964/g.92398 Transcript_31964/m.92398 type:complete len:213 (-) Transcript_31964:744-1382(-)
MRRTDNCEHPHSAGRHEGSPSEKCSPPSPLLPSSPPLPPAPPPAAAPVAKREAIPPAPPVPLRPGSRCAIMRILFLTCIVVCIVCSARMISSSTSSHLFNSSEISWASFVMPLAVTMRMSGSTTACQRPASTWALLYSSKAPSSNTCVSFTSSKFTPGGGRSKRKPRRWPFLNSFNLKLSGYRWNLMMTLGCLISLCIASTLVSPLMLMMRS